MATVVSLIIDQVDAFTATLCSDPQQTGFKGNLRLLIKPFEQPHLPFKILSAALRCSARIFCFLLPPLTSQFVPGYSSLCPQSKGLNDLLHLAFSLCPGEMNHKESYCSYLCFLMLQCIFRNILKIAHGSNLLVMHCCWLNCDVNPCSSNQQHLTFNDLYSMSTHLTASRVNIISNSFL